MKITVVVLAGLASAIVPTAGAYAEDDTRVHTEADGTFVVNDLCDFPVTVTAHADYDTTTVDTGQGSISRIHAVETDIYSANGNTLQGSYTFQIQSTYDEEGNVIQGYQTGVIVRIPLPNGDTFAVTGRADALNAQTDYISSPTHGVTRNLDEFCAYLAP